MRLKLNSNKSNVACPGGAVPGEKVHAGGRHYSLSDQLVKSNQDTLYTMISHISYGRVWSTDVSFCTIMEAIPVSHTGMLKKYQDHWNTGS